MNPGIAVFGVTLVCYAVAVAVYGDRSVQRMMQAYNDEAGAPSPVVDTPPACGTRHTSGTHHTERGGYM